MEAENQSHPRFNSYASLSLSSRSTPHWWSSASTRGRYGGLHGAIRSTSVSFLRRSIIISCAWLSDVPDGQQRPEEAEVQPHFGSERGAWAHVALCVHTDGPARGEASYVPPARERRRRRGGGGGGGGGAGGARGGGTESCPRLRISTLHALETRTAELSRIEQWHRYSDK